MSLRPPPRRLAAPALGLAAALLLAGCGSGQKAQTYQEKSVADATNDSVGTIAVRNLAVEGPPTGTVLLQGSDAPMTVTLVNEGGQDDTLVSVTTPAAASVDVVGPSRTLEVPRLSSTGSAYSLRLRDLTSDIQTGTFIDLTLTFERNGVRTLIVPVQVTPEGVQRKVLDYEVDETDSAGKPIVGDNTPDSGSDPKGDQGNPVPASE